MSLWQFVFERVHFEKKFSRNLFLAQTHNWNFWITSKTTSLWQRIVTKPLDRLLTTRLHSKDNGHIFHLAPWDLKSVHLLGHSCLVKFMGPLCLIGKLSEHFYSVVIDCSKPTEWKMNWWPWPATGRVVKGAVPAVCLPVVGAVIVNSAHCSLANVKQESIRAFLSKDWNIIFL